MNAAVGSTDPLLAPDKTAAAFRAWIRRLVSGAAELEAFDAGEIDAVMDRDSGCALLLPEAQSALRGTSRIALSAFDALPGEVCVLDASGVVVMANKAWRVSGATHARAGLDVRAGENFFAACRDAPDSERAPADAVAAGLRSVLAGLRPSLRFQYVSASPRGNSEFTLTMTATSESGPMNVLLTREWHGEDKPGGKLGKPTPIKKPSTAAATRAVAENRMLAALPARDHARLERELEPVQLKYGEVLYEPGELMRNVYFPGTSLVSLMTLVEGHRALEVGLVGREGMVGARLALGATRSTVRAYVQGGGTAMRMNAESFLHEFRRSPPLQRLLLKFNDRLMDQISQSAICNRFHIVEARMARWLMMTTERMRSATFRLTHVFIADILGVRREGVTVAAIALQRRGIIQYRRGNITVLDQQKLEAACCSCYRKLPMTEVSSN